MMGNTMMGKVPCPHLSPPLPSPHSCCLQWYYHPWGKHDRWKDVIFPARQLTAESLLGAVLGGGNCHQLLLLPSILSIKQLQQPGRMGFFWSLVPEVVSVNFMRPVLILLKPLAAHGEWLATFLLFTACLAGLLLAERWIACKTSSHHCDVHSLGVTAEGLSPWPFSPEC